jgi:hypothetical protein
VRKSHRLSGRPANQIPFPFSIVFCGDESQSQCMKSHFPSQIKNKQIPVPFYPFRALVEQTANEKLLHTLLTKLIIIRGKKYMMERKKKI